MPETDTLPPAPGKMYIRPHRADDTVLVRLVIEADWGVLVFPDREAVNAFAKQHGYSIVEGGENDASNQSAECE